MWTVRTSRSATTFGACNSANMITNLPAFANGLDGYANGDHAYDLDPARDQGSGPLLRRQPQRIPYGPPLPVPAGTPWQLQQQLGGAAGRAEAVAARPALATLLGRPTVDRLTATSPWFGILAASDRGRDPSRLPEHGAAPSAGRAGVAFW